MRKTFSFALLDVVEITAGVLAQTAQRRKVNNYKGLYGNLDNRLKRIFTHKSSQ